MNLKRLLADYLRFSRRDQLAILTLLLLIIAVYMVPTFLPRSRPSFFQLSDSLMNALPAERVDSFQRHAAERRYSSGKQTTLFLFDPNTLDAEGWLRLGLREKTVRTIMNFLAKGGKFRQASDLSKIYGLFPDEYEKLAPYVRIPSQTPVPRSEPPSPPEVSRSPRIIDINTADSLEFTRLPGIGPTLARRIILFRTKLGGFYDISQVSEVFGLHDSTFQQLKPFLSLSQVSLAYIPINTATVDELKAHPYFRPYAVAIIAYRQQHGDFQQKTDLRKIMQISAAGYEKLEPYILISR